MIHISRTKHGGLPDTPMSNSCGAVNERSSRRIDRICSNFQFPAIEALRAEKPCANSGLGDMANEYRHQTEERPGIFLIQTFDDVHCARDQLRQSDSDDFNNGGFGVKHSTFCIFMMATF